MKFIALLNTFAVGSTVSDAFVLQSLRGRSDLGLTTAHHYSSVWRSANSTRPEAARPECFASSGEICKGWAGQWKDGPSAPRCNGGGTCDGAGTRCICPPNQCGAPNLRCSAGTGSVVASAVRFRNVRYPDYYMTFTRNVFHDPGVGLPEYHTTRSSSFKVVAFPPSSSEKYALFTDDGNSVLTYEDGPVLVDMLDGQADVDILPELVGFDVANPQRVGIEVWSAPTFKGDPRASGGSLQIVLLGFSELHKDYRGRWRDMVFYRNIQGETQLMQGKHPSYGGVDVAGYWVVEPPLPMRPRPYRFANCTVDCGEYGSGWYEKKGNVIFGRRALVCFALFCCLAACFACFVRNVYIEACSRMSRAAAAKRVAEMEERYKKATEFVKTWDAGKKASNAEKLVLYGLSRQIEIGNNSESRPWAIRVEACAKWDAWDKNWGKPKEECMKLYVEELERQIKAYDPDNAGF